jgi:hypothetical protein
MNRNTYYQVRKILRGGALTDNQQRYVDRLGSAEAKEAKRREFEAYNASVAKQETQTRQGIIPAHIEEATRTARERERYMEQLAQEQADAGGFEKWSYGDNKPIVFDLPNQQIKASDGSPAVAIRKNKWNNWEIDYADKSREFVPTGDERFFLIGQKINADDIPELVEKIQMRIERIKEEQERQRASQSGLDRFFESVNDALIDIADVGTLFTPSIASTAYETFRPEKSSERRERQVNEFVEGALQSKTQAEKTYGDLQPGGRLHGLLEYDPELAEKIQQFNEYGPQLRRALEGSGTTASRNRVAPQPQTPQQVAEQLLRRAVPAWPRLRADIRQRMINEYIAMMPRRQRQPRRVQVAPMPETVAEVSEDPRNPTEESIGDPVNGGAKYALHAVIISNKVPYPDALKSAQSITKKKKIFMRATEESYRFRNIPKTKFVQSSFRSKVVNPDITLVFGKLK